jgi:hypothetical protein
MTIEKISISNFPTLTKNLNDVPFHAVIRRSGINNVKIHFITGRPSSRVFAPLRDIASCREDWETCKSEQSNLNNV